MEQNATPKLLTTIAPFDKVGAQNDEARNRRRSARGHEIERRALGLKMATTLASKPRR